MAMTSSGVDQVQSDSPCDERFGSNRDDNEHERDNGSLFFKLYLDKVLTNEENAESREIIRTDLLEELANARLDELTEIL